MLLERACDWLGWPEPKVVLEPKGEGAAVRAASVQRRIIEPLKRTCPHVTVDSGILTADPNGAATSHPLAIVCQFPSGASPDVLDEVHRLAWNYSAAIAAVTRVMELAPPEPAAFFDRGRYRLRIGDLDHTIADFSQGLVLRDERNNDFYEHSLHFMRAEALIQVGKRAEALADLAHVPEDYTFWTTELRSKAELLAL